MGGILGTAGKPGSGETQNWDVRRHCRNGPDGLGSSAYGPKAALTIPIPLGATNPGHIGPDHGGDRHFPTAK
jgi:hypothetical protein